MRANLHNSMLNKSTPRPNCTQIFKQKIRSVVLRLIKVETSCLFLILPQNENKTKKKDMIRTFLFLFTVAIFHLISAIYKKISSVLVLFSYWILFSDQYLKFSYKIWKSILLSDFFSPLLLFKTFFSFCFFKIQFTKKLWFYWNCRIQSGHLDIFSISHIYKKSHIFRAAEIRALWAAMPLWAPSGYLRSSLLLR